MLIRSQDKKVLIDMNQLTIKALEDISMRIPAQSDQNHKYYIKAWGTGDSSDHTETLGTYSSEGKTIKVLDMIQEAYMAYKSGEIISNGLAVTAYTASYDTKESVAHGIAALEGYLNVVRKSILFQMPEDSEVEA